MQAAINEIVDQVQVADISITNTGGLGGNYENVENSAEVEQVAEQENECEQAGCSNFIGPQVQVGIVDIGIDNLVLVATM